MFSKGSSRRARTHAHTHTRTPKPHGNFTLRRQLLFRPRFICHSLHGGQRVVYKRCSFCSLSCKKTHLSQLIAAQSARTRSFLGNKSLFFDRFIGFFCVWGCSGADSGRGGATSSSGCLGTPESKNLTEEVEQTSQAGVISQTLSMACEKLGGKKSMKMDKPLH